MKNYVKKTLDRDEWISAKENTIGGSEAAAIVGKSKWLTKTDLYSKMVLGKSKKVSTNSRMIEGTLAEKHIRELFALDDKRFLIENPPARKNWFFYRKDKPYLSCTPDGLGTEKKTGKRIGVEIKDVELIKRDDINAWEGGLLPEQYYFQILQYFVVLNDLDVVVLVAHLKYFKHDDLNDEWVFDYAKDVPYFVYRDEVNSHIAYLEKKETEFYEINIKGRKRPKVEIKF